MKNEEVAVNKFIEGYNCAQSVMFSLMSYTGLSENDSLRMATGFGAGMGRTQQVCGAVSGGILALSHLFGRDSEEGKDKQNEMYALTRRLIADFEREYNTVVCRDLLDGCDLLSDEGQQRFQSENMAERCQNYIESVVIITERFIKEMKS